MLVKNIARCIVGFGALLSSQSLTSAAVNSNDLPDLQEYLGVKDIPSIAESDQVLAATRQAFNENCADVDLSIRANQSLCAETQKTLVQAFATQYAAQYQVGGSISQQNFMFAVYGATNLGRICGDELSRAQTPVEIATASIRCVTSVNELENDKKVKGINPLSGLVSDFGRGEAVTKIDKALFNVIGIASVCIDGKINHNKGANNFCKAVSKQNGLHFKP